MPILEKLDRIDLVMLRLEIRDLPEDDLCDLLDIAEMNGPKAAVKLLERELDRREAL